MSKLDHLPLLVLPLDSTPSLANVLNLIAVLRTGNFTSDGITLAPYAGPVTAEALMVAFDRLVELRGPIVCGWGPVPYWKAATIGERYLRLCQLAAFAVAAAEEVHIEIEASNAAAQASAAYQAAADLLPCDVEA